ncbi:MAG: nucleotide exchange factor GrpE [Pyrinomonadaceae bacterium]|nr:nucleotide exchange factor GrpE [Pyrinomonadaceae bacterium]
MINNKSQTPGRIPVRFVDDEPDEDLATAPEQDDADDGELTPGELGRASSYEDATEMQRRIDRGQEQDSAGGHEAADTEDVAGGPQNSDLPENREDKDTTRQVSASFFESRGAHSMPTAAARPEPARGGAGGSSLAMQAEVLAAQAELGMVENELKKAVTERQELQETLARRQADFDNYRKRIERERVETYQRAVGEVVKQLLPVVDNLRRAIDTESTVKAEESEEFRHFLHGVELINKQLNGVLENLGLKPVATAGQHFDPHVHEAIATEVSETLPPDTVIQEVVRGYRLGDKLLRPALVKVSTK